MGKQRKDKYNDLGLGSKSSDWTFRSLNKDGSFNVRKINVPLLERMNFFHALINMSWAKFILLVVIGFCIVNVFFASIYFFIGVEHLTGVKATSQIDAFFQAFFFSTQTVTTLGYGRVAPLGYLSNIVAAIESMLGLLSFALATGLLYGRFSKPFAKIKYSEKAVISPYKDINGFMFKIVNPQSSNLLEVEVNVSLSMKRDNEALRDFFSLTLERRKVNFLPYTWTVVHPIDETSPLYRLSKEDVIGKDAEFIIMIKAFDESFSQLVYSRSSYKADELFWGEKFANIIDADQEGTVIDVSRLDETIKKDLNP